MSTLSGRPTNQRLSRGCFNWPWRSTSFRKGRLRVTPAMAAGMTDRLWEVEDIDALIEAEEAKVVAKRGPYRRSKQSTEELTQ